MSRPVSLLALILASTVGLSTDALAGGCGRFRPRPIITPVPVSPIGLPAPTVRLRPIGFQPPVAPARQWYFGMSLQVIQTTYGRGLQVATVTPGSPAALAGLEPGDTLLVASGVSLQNALSNEHGVQLLQSAVVGSAPAPTAAAALVVPPSPSVLLTVIDIRTQRATQVAVSPLLSGSPAVPAPTAAAAAF